MFKSAFSRLANVLISKGISRNEDKDIIVYGLSAGIELLFNMITTMVFGLFFGLIIESIVFLVSFSFIRTNAGGYHCRKAINCYFFSSGVVLLVLAIAKFTPTGYMLPISLVVILICLPIILKLAPIGTKTKPLDEVERKHFRKKTVLYLCIEYIVVAILLFLNFHVLSFVICLGILVATILVFLGDKQNKSCHRKEQNISS